MAILNWDERATCVLADVMGLHEDEIARIRNVSIDSIRATKSRARRQLRDVLQLQRAAPRQTAVLTETLPYSHDTKNLLAR